MNFITANVISGYNDNSGFRNVTMGLDVKPVIKISLEGFLISANSTGLEFLELLSNEMKVPAVSYLIKHCPSILDPNCNIDVSFRILDTKYFFSAVAFKEAGYVGLYAFRLVHLNSNFGNRIL